MPIANQTLRYPSTIKRYSHQSYGGDDNPQGDRPASRKSRDLEHPGPPPPDVSKDSAESNPSSKKQSEKQEQEQEQAKHEDLYQKKQPSNKARPTLSSGRESPNVDEQGNVRDDVPEDVKRHNREMEQRHDKAYNQIGDEGKVNKGFWKGNGESLTEEQGGGRAQR
ncbi:uncharacterized protein BHQ10_000771 [Talaromyces amestolkiae]|uniref:Uncharacterized protein n=1 Tax=Talaromyces amestolkiae TaxID=1196081 RepID=A0A364KMI2_TALAM|nr:uncharacterized protein BHQ10_000771 [Talaromyces amestolkiae]RAO64759.1 hypothetical protein BHQ10_000771 [Talaromyces amestolkiae]